ncbi:response regulator [Roseateles saccharophilus]|uniref:LuxR family two component transcriptional regulator n=1 Tax=Roseateles saccharophilus TaxID=304 RepID=A0A4R3V0J3_ROSSA|nr:response regulator [Roseateles saccharophilus]MDG0832336.1 response regulator [Roseateles saccharophilus]TCU97030.1 LuxR family two component transcriptional regulator [Roseateles saccharophilus]
MNAAPIRVLVVDDHTLFRRGLIALLATQPQLQVVGEAGDAGGAERLAAELQPQVVLLDNHLPGVSGVQALPALKAAAPSAQVLMLTMSESEADLGAALRAGACGYLLKTADNQELTQAIERAARGVSSFSAEMAGKLATAFRHDAEAASTAAAPPPDPLSTLSPREREIVDLIARGDSNKQIARELGIAETTVKIHVQHLLRKLDLDSRVQAAVLVTQQRA